MKKGILFDIERSSFVDGPGIRTTVFFKGCNLRCAWCHNPESQSGRPQMLVYQDKCIGCGKCSKVCPVNKGEAAECGFCGRCELFCPADARKIKGREYSAEEVMCQLRRDKGFYENSGGGVTFSGGECMLQPDFLLELLTACKAEGIHTAVDTAGCVPWEVFERILPVTDLFLYDVKCFDSAKHRQFTGVGNEMILSNLGRVLQSRAEVWIRIPVMEEVNASVEEMRRIRQFLAQYPAPQKIELLPYHAMGENKYRAMGTEPTRFSAPAEEKMRALKAVFNEEPQA